MAHVPHAQACEARPQLPEPSARQPPHRKRRGGSGENTLAPGRSSLAVGCIAEHRAGHNVCTGLRRSVPRDRADDGGIHRNLRAMPERQPIANDIDAPRIVDRHMEVHKHGRWRAPRARPEMQGHLTWRRPHGGPQAHLARGGRNSGWGRAAAASAAGGEQDAEE